MGMESVEIVIRFEDEFGIIISDEEAVSMKTPRVVMDLIWAQVKERGTPQFCPTQRAFHILRAGFSESVGVARNDFRLATELETIVPTVDRKSTWRSLGHELGVKDWPSLQWQWFWSDQPPQFPPSMATVRQLTSYFALKNYASLTSWTRLELEHRVRLIIKEELGVEEFSDNDRFIEDMGIG